VFRPYLSHIVTSIRALTSGPISSNKDSPARSEGFEPSTCYFGSNCSTTELRALNSPMLPDKGFEVRVGIEPTYLVLQTSAYATRPHDHMLLRGEEGIRTLIILLAKQAPYLSCHFPKPLFTVA
jgi:hypothetical protein